MLAKAMILSGEMKLVLCDELNIVLRYEYLPLDEVLDFLKMKNQTMFMSLSPVEMRKKS